jgi:uncharacterized protein YqeY
LKHKALENKCYDEECKIAMEEMKKIRKVVDKRKKRYQHKFSMIRNKKGELAVNTKEKAEIWKDYFDKLLNTEELKEVIKKETN